MNEYEKKAADFLKKTGATITAHLAVLGRHFIDDTENRDTYVITIQRGARSYTFKYGDSIANTEKRIESCIPDEAPARVRNNPEPYMRSRVKFRNNTKQLQQPEAAGVDGRPTPYDILSALTTYEPPQDVDEFAKEFGYTEISQAVKTHKAVLKEWEELQKLFSDEELAQLQEIN